MKKLKSILSILTIMVLILINTNAIAYSGKFDVEDEIKISEYLINGKGEIDIARNVAGYKLYCQANVMDNDTYKQIKRLKDELNVIYAYNIYEASKSEDSKNAYESTQIYYKSLYGTNVEDFSDQKADENMSIIISLLPNYTDKWEETTDNTFNINLSSFSGTKDIVVWVQLEKMDGTRIYDAEVYEVTGTKQDNNVNTNTSVDNNNSTIENGVANDTNSTNTSNNTTNNTNSTNTSNNTTNNTNSTNTNNNTTNNTNSTNTNNNTTNNTNSTNTNNNTTNNTNSTNTNNNTTNNTNSTNTNNNTTNNANSTNRNNSTTNSTNSSSKKNNTTSKNSSTVNNGSANNKGTTSTTNNSTVAKSDKTTSTEKLPYTGVKEKTIIASIVISMIGAGIFYIKYKKIK